MVRRITENKKLTIHTRTSNSQFNQRLLFASMSFRKHIWENMKSQFHILKIHLKKNWKTVKYMASVTTEEDWSTKKLVCTRCTICYYKQHIVYVCYLLALTLTSTQKKHFINNKPHQICRKMINIRNFHLAIMNSDFSDKVKVLTDDFVTDHMSNGGIYFFQISLWFVMKMCDLQV